MTHHQNVTSPGYRYSEEFLLDREAEKARRISALIHIDKQMPEGWVRMAHVSDLEVADRNAAALGGYCRAIAPSGVEIARWIEGVRVDTWSKKL